MQEHPRVNVVTMGAGWTAGILAWRLTMEGLSMVSIEQGPQRWTIPDFQHNHDYLRYVTRKAMMVTLNRETWTWRPNPRKPALPTRQYGPFHPGQGIGGAGVHWAGESWRFYPTDFAYRSHHIARYGENRLPEGSRVQDWPVTYLELEPYYTRVEHDIGMAGVAGNIRGEIQPGGNPFEAPRSTDYPLPPLARSLPSDIFANACEELGLHPFPQATGILPVAYKGLAMRQRSGCLYCGYCTRFGCEVDAKASANVIHIPLALETGNYEIRTYSHVTRIRMNSNGTAAGLEYIDLRTGQRHFQPADIVIISGYTLANVRMLLLSRSATHTNGVGNNRGMVGKNYTYQLVQTPATGIFEGRRFNQFVGNAGIGTAIHDYNADNFDHSDLDFIGGAGMTSGMGERDPLTSTLDMPEIDEDDSNDNGEEEEEENGNGNGEEENGEEKYRKRPALYDEVGSLAGSGTEWGEKWKENLRQNWDGVVGIGIQGESLPYEDSFLDLDPNYNDSFGLPLLRMTFDFHQNDYSLYHFLAARAEEIMKQMNPTRMVINDELGPFDNHSYQSTHNTGGTIMGDNPGNSVTNKYGQVWDAPNVFVTGASLYPQNPGMNPTETLLALVYMTADAIVDKYLDNEGDLMV
jgi:gluconate 2-dehydrogenase alpha chain